MNQANIHLLCHVLDDLKTSTLLLKQILDYCSRHPDVGLLSPRDWRSPAGPPCVVSLTTLLRNAAGALQECLDHDSPPAWPPHPSLETDHADAPGVTSRRRSESMKTINAYANTINHAYRMDETDVYYDLVPKENAPWYESYAAPCTIALPDEARVVSDNSILYDGQYWSLNELVVACIAAVLPTP